ncbi:MAG: hypothetical protein IIC24_12155 [Chloroflexi bacterium]|nr:hypothetical protein [Chloroflexota bacterium]
MVAVAVVVVAVVLEDVMNLLGERVAVPASARVESFETTITFDPTNLEVVGIRTDESFAGNVVSDVDAIAGRVTVRATLDGRADGESMLPTALVRLVVRLKGNALDATQMSLESLTTRFAGTSSDVEQRIPAVGQYLRGDTRADGEVTIIDALYIAQCLAGQRGYGEGVDHCNAVNAASVRQDDGAGDKVSIKDALFIAQFLVKARDTSFNTR